MRIKNTNPLRKVTNTRLLDSGGWVDVLECGHEIVNYHCSQEHKKRRCSQCRIKGRKND